MREIKFRVWTGRRMSGYGVALSNGSIYSTHDSEILMQYTGFDDIDGKPIYESDYISNYLFRLRVDWDEGSGQWVTGESPLWHAIDDGTYRVTGNVHENPELLKKEA